MPTSSRRHRGIQKTRLAGFVFGPNDISRETRIRMQPGRAAMIPMITHCILATRAHGLEILDGPYSDISNIDGFATECAQGRDLGFDGKTLIHPSHIEACNAIFTPPAKRWPKRARSLRPSKAGKRLPRRDPARRPDGGAAPRRYGEAHDCDRRRDRGDGRTRARARSGSAVMAASRVHSTLHGVVFDILCLGAPRLFAKPLRRPRIEAAGNGLFATAAFWRDVQADDFGDR